MPDTPTFGRYAEIPVEQMTAEQQAGYRFLVDGPRGRLPGPYHVWVHNPKLVHAIRRSATISRWGSRRCRSVNGRSQCS